MSNTKSSRSARKIIEEYVQMPDPEDLEMEEEEQDILDATSRRSRSMSNDRSNTTPKQGHSVRKELKFAGLLNTSVTPTNANYSMHNGGGGGGGVMKNSSSYMLPHS